MQKVNKSKLKTAQSIAQAAAAWGIPKRDLQRAKDAGCPAFRGSRVHYDDLSEWMNENPEPEEIVGGKEEWDIERLKKICRKMDREHSVATGELVPRSAIREAMASALQPMLDVLDKHLDKTMYNVIAGELKKAITKIAG